MEASPDELREAVERVHKCSARLIDRVPVIETFLDQTVWDGVVHVFEIEGHARATRCYAWTSPVEGAARCRFTAVLDLPPIDSPSDAVKLAILQEYRASSKREG
jgi:hypothetical protein